MMTMTYIKFKTFTESISLQYHATLNPKLWDVASGTLKEPIRRALIRFGYAWSSYANIPLEDIQDIYLTGGNANFNYTDVSDVDVHVVVDKRVFGLPDVFIDDYLQDKKTLWKLKHNITVAGAPVEPYAQSPGEQFPVGQGVYSLLNDRWVQKPEHGNYDFENDPVLNQKVEHYERLINQTVVHGASREATEALKNRIETMRGAGLKRAGEFSLENLVFKELRNRGLVDKLKDYARQMDDDDLSYS